MTKFTYVAFGLALLVLMSTTPIEAQTYTDVHDFVNTDGCCTLYPAALAQGQDGNIYGTSTSGGTVGYGSVFSLTTSGTYTNIHNFDLTNGGGPQGGLSMGFDGNFYGTTYVGGAHNAGTVFKITPGGGFSLLYSFTNGSDGGYPRTPPVQAGDGNLYGATGNGTQYALYKLTPTGTFSVIAALPGQSYSPFLVGVDGNLYGTTVYGGTLNRGTVFKFTPTTKKVTIIHNFNVTTEGGTPYGPLMQGTDGKLYGTTPTGGSGNGGTIFKMTTSGAITVVYKFDNSVSTNSATPYAGLVQGSDGYLYGVASVGGVNKIGTLFKVSATGMNFTVLHNFDGTTGDTPFATPLLHTSGKIYGVANHGGTHTGYGVIYSMDAGLKPFVSQFVYYSGKVGANVTILGQGFSNAAGVKFGAGPGTFVASTDAYMTATVAAGAMTGKITALEPGGNLTTPQNYKVIPTVSSISPTTGPVGTAVVIKGMSLTQTTTVTFGGVKATSVTKNSDTQITATVPTGALTGKVKVTTSGGSATSAQTFTVQ